MNFTNQLYKIISFVLILLCYCSQLSSQSIPLGGRTDCSGESFDNYYSHFTYSPNKLLIIHSNNEYEKGKLYTKSGVNHEGYIKLDDNKIYFKKTINDSKKKYKTQEIKYVKIGIDSFFTSSDFRDDKERILHFLGKTEKIIFARYFKITKKKVKKYYLAKENTENALWTPFDEKEDFNNTVLDYFGHLPKVIEKLNSGEIKEKDIPYIIKNAVYFDKLKTHSPIYFNSSWQETPLAKKGKRKAYVTKSKDSIITLEYYLDNIKLYQISYSSFQLGIKNGLFHSYWKNGNIKKTILYKNDKKKEIKVYDEKQKLFKHYKYDSVSVASEKKHGSLRYSSNSQYAKTKTIPDKKRLVLLLNDEGNNIVENKNYIHYINTKTQTKKTHTEIYKNSEKTKSFYFLNNDSIFQIEKPNAISLIKLQENLDKYIEKEDFHETVYTNNEGILLLSIVINPKGHIISYKTLNTLEPELDDFIYSFMKNKITKKSMFQYKFKKIKPKGFYETIIPIFFSNDRFYKAPSVNYHYNFMGHQQIWQQQQMQQSINNSMNNFSGVRF